jgi:thiamine-monophosphate kinase
MKAEDRFVQQLRERLGTDPADPYGIGDDAAVLRRAPGDLIVTTDVLVESVDFAPGEEPAAIGRRAVAVNASDLAAMGARPEQFVLAIGLPAPLAGDYALRLALGAAERGRELGARLVGGDLSRARDVVAAVTMWGRMAEDAPPLLRSGARRGDAVFISGWPGRAAAGLWLASHPEAGIDEASRLELAAALKDPQPRIALGASLARDRAASAAIDVSDGLGVDGGRLARASGVRLVIEAERLPVSPALAAGARAASRDPVDWIVSGGDDYELLFTAPEASEPAIARASIETGVRITRIGRVEAGEGAALTCGGATREIGASGHDHFEGAP